MANKEEKFEKKSGFVSVIGRPNVGKSTLINKIVGQKVAITSNKPQTTRHKIRAVYNSDEGQIVFVDTPGMIEKAKNKLGEYMITVSNNAIGDCDLIIWMVEPSSYIGKEDRKIAELINKKNIPAILLINKIDTIEKPKLLAIIDAFSKVCDFEEIIPVSALRDKNEQELISCIYKYLPYGPAYYEPDEFTDQSVRQLAAEMIREKALHCLGQEVPHGIAVVIEKFEERPDKAITNVEASIICERESHKAMIIGKQGAMLKKIGSAARFEIERMLEGKVFLKIYVKVKKNWRDSKTQIKNFGYNSKEI